ncbi:lamin tail domain-containing protein [Haloplanus sp. C73]|uniref:lamin tail domain-containing protein n=1 Tax=Haloplanus sp. C73 TaxID=3421641 RepID=UPI003EBE47F5
MTEDDADERDGDASISRRRFALGGAIGVVALGGAGAYLSSQSSTADETYLLQQGYLRWTVEPISHDGDTVEEFYDYQDGTASPEASVIEDDAASRLFVYDGPVDRSLVFLHGSPAVDHGGSATFSFSGLSRDRGEWAVRDDPEGIDDDFDPWNGGNAKVRWEWGANATDGGAYWGVLDRSDFTISITPTELRGVDLWRFRSGELGSLDTYELSQSKPAKLKPARGRTVKRANVDIMPDSESNEFDPYAEEPLVVAVRAPPDVADPSNWVAPSALDPGNYAVNFGSKEYLAGQNAAQPQRHFSQDGTLYLEYTARAANFSLDSAYGYLVTKTGEDTFVRGRDVVRPGGFDNVEREQPQLVVTDLNVAPESETLVDEYVEFENDGDEPLDLTGHDIRDEEGWTFHLPDGFTLEAGQRFRLHTGDREWTDTDLYWDVEHSVWDDDGDTILVLDADGEEILEYSYPRQ